MISIQDFTILNNASPKQISLLISLQKEVENFCEFPLINHKTRISIKGNRKNNICTYELKGSDKIEVSFNLHKDVFYDPKNLIVDTESKGIWGKKSSVFLIELDDVPYIATLIQQSYKENK